MTFWLRQIFHSEILFQKSIVEYHKKELCPRKAILVPLHKWPPDDAGSMRYDQTILLSSHLLVELRALSCPFLKGLPHNSTSCSVFRGMTDCCTAIVVSWNLFEESIQICLPCCAHECGTYSTDRLMCSFNVRSEIRLSLSALCAVGRSALIEVI